VTAAKKLVEDTSTGGHQLYTSNLSAVAGKKHTFQVDVQRDAGTRDIRLTIGDSRTYANCTDMIVSLRTGTIGQITGNSTTFTYATGSVRKLDNNAWRITISTIIESTTGVFTITGGINFIPAGTPARPAMSATGSRPSARGTCSGR
jgi:hypothetical protein